MARPESIRLSCEEAAQKRLSPPTLYGAGVMPRKLMQD
jgi:hypothetical protein